MSALLLSFAYFLLGVAVGAFLLFAFWKHYQAKLTAEMFKQMLATQGYTIKDKRIVPMDEQPQSDMDEQLSKIMEEL